MVDVLSGGLRVIVCGSVGYGGKEEITRLQARLRLAGYVVVDQFEDADYSGISDFRDAPELCRNIVLRDLEKCREADVVVLIATRPSFGATVEALLSALRGKPVVAYCPGEVRSPWPLYVSSHVAKTVNELLMILEGLGKERAGLRTLPNLQGEHEATFTYSGFTCLCPVTGTLDRATIKVRYVPRGRLIEYESLKDYFETFKGKFMHHEEVVATILSDVVKAVEPELVEVEAVFEERSGVRARVTKVWRKNGQTSSSS
ncbi:MAG: preQ(1) synthase [Candidatus Jordarchaeales archaeon]|nr:preQ(1) synthase [Candidatus Jordarchaeia archaeon]